MIRQKATGVLYLAHPFCYAVFNRERQDKKEKEDQLNEPKTRFKARGESALLCQVL